MAKLVYAIDSKSVTCESVRVRLPFRAPNKKNGLDTIIKPFLYLDMRAEIPHLIVEGNKIYNMCESKPYDGAKPMYLVEDIDNRDILKVIIINKCNSLLIKKENKSKFIKGSD